MDKLTEAGGIFTGIVGEVFRLNGLFVEAGDRMTAPVGQTGARWQVLAVVADGPASVSQVARTMGLARQSVQRTADLLAADGLVRYVENPYHRRAKLMEVTSEARRVLGYIQQRQVERANQIGEQHDLERMRAAAAVLRQLREGLERGKQGKNPSTGSDV